MAYRREGTSFCSLANTLNFSRAFYQYVVAIQKSNSNFPPRRGSMTMQQHNQHQQHHPLYQPHNIRQHEQYTRQDHDSDIQSDNCLAPILSFKEDRERIDSTIGEYISSRSNSWTDAMGTIPSTKSLANLVHERRYSAPSTTTLVKCLQQRNKGIESIMEASPSHSSSSNDSDDNHPIDSKHEYGTSKSDSHYESISMESKYYSCKWDNCMESFSTRTGLATHCSTHLSQLVSLSDQLPSSNPMHNHPSQHNNNGGNSNTSNGKKRVRAALPCRWDGCQECFYSLKELAKHLSTESHVGQTPFIPKEELETDAQLNEIANKNKRRKKFYCSIPGCGKCFTDSSNRKAIHIECNIQNNPGILEARKNARCK
jgi:hypothetical protein